MLVAVVIIHGTARATTVCENLNFAELDVPRAADVDGYKRQAPTRFNAANDEFRVGDDADPRAIHEYFGLIIEKIFGVFFQREQIDSGLFKQPPRHVAAVAAVCNVRGNGEMLLQAVVRHVDRVHEAPLRSVKQAGFDDFCGSVERQVYFSQVGNCGIVGKSIQVLHDAGLSCEFAAAPVAFECAAEPFLDDAVFENVFVFFDNVGEPLG